MDAKGAVTTYVRDASGQLQALVDPLGQRTTYTWDSKWPTAIQDPRGYVFTYQYQSLAADANLRQLQAVVLPEGGRFTYQLDGSDNLVAVIDERGYRTSMTYASARLATIQDPLGRVTSYSYSTQFNQPSEIQDALGQRWTAVYDSRAKDGGHQPQGRADHVYVRRGGFCGDGEKPAEPSDDPDARWPEPADARDQSPGRDYQLQLRLGLLPLAGPDGPAWFSDHVSVRRPGASGRDDQRAGSAHQFHIRRQRQPDRGGKRAGPARSTSTYDKLNRLESVTSALGYKTSYTYNKSGSVETVKDALNQVITNVYDKNRRLSAVANPLGQRSTFGYDVAGNRTSVQDALGFVATTTYGAGGRERTN